MLKEIFNIKHFFTNADGSNICYKSGNLVIGLQGVDAQFEIGIALLNKQHQYEWKKVAEPLLTTYAEDLSSSNTYSFIADVLTTDGPTRRELIIALVQPFGKEEGVAVTPLYIPDGSESPFTWHQMVYMPLYKEE